MALRGRGCGRGRAIARALAVGLCAALVACAPTTGWQHTDRRACAPQSGPILCLSPEPEGPHELRVGERTVLPGECVELASEEESRPSSARGGRLRVELRSSGTVVARPRIGVRRGVRTVVEVDGARLRVRERRECDQQVDVEF